MPIDPQTQALYEQLMGQQSPSWGRAPLSPVTPGRTPQQLENELMRYPVSLPKEGFLGTTPDLQGHLALRSALQQRYFAGELTPRQVQDAAETYAQQDPRIDPYYFVKHVLYGIGFAKNPMGGEPFEIGYSEVPRN